MKARLELFIWAAALGAATSATGCAEDTPIFVARPPPPETCDLKETPQRYEVYFVIDVSGSMRPFNAALAGAVQSFSRAFPDRDASDNRVLVDYYVIAFVNDVLFVPNNARRMTEPVAVQGAIETAIDLGADNTLLTSNLKNAESEENLLDALAEVIGNDPREDAELLVIIGTDAGFEEAPSTLSGGIQVRSNYTSIRADLESIGARVYTFTPDALDGLTRQYAGQPSLSSLPGSAAYSLREVAASADLIEQTLLEIAESAACN